MRAIAAVPTGERLKSIFAIHGIPRKIVTDNGPSSVSEEFRLCMSQNGIIHITSAPYHPSTNGIIHITSAPYHPSTNGIMHITSALYHPSTNGLAERAIQSFKQGLLHQKVGSIETKLSCFLFKYRLTPHSTTGTSPAELLLGRHPRSRLES